MITQNDLEICKQLRNNADYITETIMRLRAQIEGTTARITDMPRAQMGGHDKIGEGISKLDELIEKWQNEAEAYAEHADIVASAISEIENPVQQRILRMRYVDGLQWDEIGEKENYSRMQCYRIHQQGLIALGVKEDTQ